MLTELENQNREAARRDFIAAVRQGLEPAKLLPLASAAGLTARDADDLLSRLRQGKEQIEHANRLPGLRKEATAAKARFEKIQANAKAEISRLEAEVDAAAIEADTTQKAVYAAESSARQLLVLHDHGLLSPDEMPAEVRRLIERRTAEEKARQADVARANAEAERNRRRAAVSGLEDKLVRMPVILGSRREELEAKDVLKAAKRELAEAEGRLTKAQAAAEAAHKAIP